MIDKIIGTLYNIHGKALKQGTANAKNDGPGGIALNSKLQEFKNSIREKKVAVLGVGISNTPLIKYLSEMGVRVTAFDRADENQLKDTLESLDKYPVEYRLGESYLKSLKGFDLIFKTPKVRFDIPELEAERARGAAVTSEMEVFMELCPAEVFAVTGSDGKTTTTTLIYKILCRQGYKCWLGGNIGTPLLDRIEEIGEDDKVVLELSSFQLHTMKKSPRTAVVTNLSPNHLDVHKSMEEYIDAKRNIFRYQSPSDRLVLNYDNEITRAFSSEAAGGVVYFSRLDRPERGAFIEEDRIVFSDGNTRQEIVKTDEIILPGAHNIENYLAATAAVMGCVKPEAVAGVAASFKGVEHRLELAGEVGGIRFYNDSIATSPTRTIAGLNSFKQKVILIAGGYDKHIPYEAMGESLAEKVKALVLSGPTAPKIAEALRLETERSGRGRDVQTAICGSFEETVEKAFKLASPGDIIVLSPASASFDRFKNFEERGNRFKELVSGLMARGGK